MKKTQQTFPSQQYDLTDVIQRSPVSSLAFSAYGAYQEKDSECDTVLDYLEYDRNLCVTGDKHTGKSLRNLFARLLAPYMWSKERKTRFFASRAISKEAFLFARVLDAAKARYGMIRKYLNATAHGYELELYNAVLLAAYFRLRRPEFVILNILINLKNKKQGRSAECAIEKRGSSADVCGNSG